MHHADVMFNIEYNKADAALSENRYADYLIHSSRMERMHKITCYCVDRFKFQALKNKYNENVNKLP